MVTVYDLNTDKVELLTGPYLNLASALSCLSGPNMILFVEKRWVKEFVQAVHYHQFSFEPASFEQGLLGHIGYIGLSPVVTNKFTDAPTLPEGVHSFGYYIAHTRREVSNGKSEPSQAQGNHHVVGGGAVQHRTDAA